LCACLALNQAQLSNHHTRTLAHERVHTHTHTHSYSLTAPTGSANLKASTPSRVIHPPSSQQRERQHRNSGTGSGCLKLPGGNNNTGKVRHACCTLQGVIFLLLHCYTLLRHGYWPCNKLLLPARLCKHSLSSLSGRKMGSGIQTAHPQASVGVMGQTTADDAEGALLHDLMGNAEVMVASFDAVRRLLLAAGCLPQRC